MPSILAVLSGRGVARGGLVSEDGFALVASGMWCLIKSTWGIFAEIA